MTPRSALTYCFILIATAATSGAQAQRPAPPPATPVFAPAPGAAAGTLKVFVTPAAIVYVDGTPVRVEIIESGVPIAIGLHRVRVTQSDYLDLVRTIKIRADQ